MSTWKALSVVATALVCARATSASAHPDPDPVAACKARPTGALDHSEVICIDARSKIPQQLKSATQLGEGDDADIVVRPNRTILVRVLVDAGDVAIKLGGNGGETIAELIGSDLKNAGVAVQGPVAANQMCNSSLLRCAKFAPRTPGVSVLTVAVTPAASAARVVTRTFTTTTTTKEIAGVAQPLVKETLTVDVDTAAPPPTTKTFELELLVPRIYSGALRVGFGSVFGASDDAYSIRKTPGSDVGELVQGNRARIVTELVIGYAPFWEALRQQGQGREYIRPKKLFSYYRLAPYFGLGVASVAAGGSSDGEVTWLRSFHIGGEFELSHGFSIAASLVARRRDHLVEGVTVGGPVPLDMTLTESKLDVGFGLVVNFTPEFFKFATSVGAK